MSSLRRSRQRPHPALATASGGRCLVWRLHSVPATPRRRQAAESTVTGYALFADRHCRLRVHCDYASTHASASQAIEAFVTVARAGDVGSVSPVEGTGSRRRCTRLRMHGPMASTKPPALSLIRVRIPQVRLWQALCILCAFVPDAEVANALQTVWDMLLVRSSSSA